MRYTSFGEVRWSNGNTPTDRTFTGQTVENAGSVGSLMDYGARFYSPILGRFISADSIVPQPGDPQSLNRFSYTLNNPLTYVDPTGHYSCIWAACAGLPTPTGTDPSLVPIVNLIIALPSAQSLLSVVAPSVAQAVASAAPVIVFNVATMAVFVGWGYAYSEATSDQPGISFPAYLGTTAEPALQPTYPLHGTGTLNASSTLYALDVQPTYLELKSNRSDKNVRVVARKWRIKDEDIPDFGRAVEDFKKGTSGSDRNKAINERGDLSWDELNELAREWVKEHGKQEGR